MLLKCCEFGNGRVIAIKAIGKHKLVSNGARSLPLSLRKHVHD
jgi:hypothetical protein